MSGFDVEVMEILKAAGGIITMLAWAKNCNPPVSFNFICVDRWVDRPGLHEMPLKWFGEAKGILWPGSGQPAPVS